MEKIEKRKTVWIFQERDAPTPWAARCTIRKLGRSYHVDCTCFCESLPNKSKQFQCVGIVLAQFPSEFSELLQSYGIPVSDTDVEQLKREREYFKDQFR